MTKVVGITCASQNVFISEWKQAALLYDAVGMLFLDSLMHWAKKGETAVSETEMELLLEKDLIFDVLWSKKWGLNFYEQKEVDYDRELFEKEMASPDMQVRTDALKRDSALRLNQCYSERFFSVPLIQKLNLPANVAATKSTVLNILIQEIPVAYDSTPWEAIFDFKADEDNVGRMAKLRRWVNNAVKSNNSPAEIRDEIEALLYDYRKSLEIHKIKYNLGAIESVVVGGLEIAENIAKLKPSKIAKGLFQVSEAEVELMKLELTAPGNELAYIYKAQQQFGK